MVHAAMLQELGFDGSKDAVAFAAGGIEVGVLRE